MTALLAAAVHCLAVLALAHAVAAIHRARDSRVRPSRDGRPVDRDAVVVR